MLTVRGISLLATTFAAAVLIPSSANAAVTINIVQSGTDVVATASGSISGITPSPTSAGHESLILPIAAVILLGPPGVETLPGNQYSITGPTSFGTGFTTIATSSSGDLFWVEGASSFIVTPAAYVAGSPIAATDTFAGQTLASLGLDRGKYVYEVIGAQGAPVDTVTVNVGRLGAVPEPATWALMLLGFGAIGFSVRRGRNLKLNAALQRA